MTNSTPTRSLDGRRDKVLQIKQRLWSSTCKLVVSWPEKPGLMQHLELSVPHNLRHLIGDFFNTHATSGFSRGLDLDTHRFANGELAKQFIKAIDKLVVGIELHLVDAYESIGVDESGGVWGEERTLEDGWPA